jgi:hypothetical protein
MSFSSKYAITDIRKEKRDSISMSIDEHDEGVIIPVMLYTPEKGKHDHSHIEFSLEQAMALRDWLNCYLALTDKELKDKYDSDYKY